jgi:hypothetical protein
MCRYIYTYIWERENKIVIVGLSEGPQGGRRVKGMIEKHIEGQCICAWRQDNKVHCKLLNNEGAEWERKRKW